MRGRKRKKDYKAIEENLEGDRYAYYLHCCYDFVVMYTYMYVKTY
jgi:hypothetical protein